MTSKPYFRHATPTEHAATGEQIVPGEHYWPAVYVGLVRMALAAGWRRANDCGDWYREADDIVRPRPLGVVIESVLRDHGVDLREPVPGEEAT